MTSTEPVDRRTALRRAAVMTDDSARTLAALGAAFDDVILLDDAEVGDLPTMSADTVVVVDGALSAHAWEAVVNHVVTRTGVCLALGEKAAAVAPGEESGMRILSSGHLGALAVTWWGAADSVVDVEALTHPSRPANPLQADADAAFVAGAHARRTFRGPRAVADVVLPADETSSEPSAATPATTRGVLTGLKSLGWYRATLALALLVSGGAIGALVAEVRHDDDLVLVLVLLLVAALVLTLAWQARMTRVLSAQLREVAGRTARSERELGKQVRQLAKRAESTDIKLQKTRERLRQVEARLAIVSTASVNAERSRARAAEASSADPERPTA